MSTDKIDENEIILQRLHFALTARGLKKHGRGIEIAEKTGYSNGQVSGLLSGKSQLSSRFIRTVCREFLINETYILEGNGDILIEQPGIVDRARNGYIIQNQIIVNKLKDHFKITKDEQLAIMLGVSDKTVADWLNGKPIDIDLIKFKYPDILPGLLTAQDQPGTVAEPPVGFSASQYGIDTSNLAHIKQALIDAVINDMSDDEAFDLAADWRVKRRGTPAGGQGSS